MATRKKILLPRSDIPNRAPTINEIDFGEIAINTHDGRAFIKREANGEVSIQSIGSEEVENVYYVSKSGSYGNDGRSLLNSFKTLDSAVATVLTKQGFKFNEKVCERDLNLIMDAVRYDMILSTNYNSVTAGLAYKRGNAIKVTTDQKYQTRRAINEERVGMISAPEVVNSSIATERIVAGFDDIIGIFYDETPDDLYFTDPPVEVQTDANAAAAAIQANRSAIQDAVIDYINTGIISGYDEAKCSRDVGLILDAVSRDLLLGTEYNTITAGNAYLRANSAYVLSNQNEATIAGINFARDYITALPDVTSDTDIDNLFLNVTNVIDGTVTTYPAISYPTTAGSTYQTSDRISAATALQTNRQTLIDETTEYINENYTGIGATCERDLGFILDAVRRDLLLGTDYNTITAGNAYLRANSAYVLSDQSAVTVALVNYARDLVKALPEINSTALIDTLFARVTQVLDGTIITVQPVTTYAGNGTYATSNLRLAQSLDLQTNRATLISSVTSFISSNYPALVYDTVACERDTGFLIDAVSHDLLYDGNTASRTAALAYFVGTNSQLGVGEETATVAAYAHLTSEIQALTNVTEDARVATLIDITRDAITAGNVSSVPAEIEVSTLGLSTTEYDNILTESNTIISNTIEYGRDNYSFYDQDTCERDVGYIIDGLSHDVKYGGNTATRTNALAYFVGATSQLGPDEGVATVAAYNDLKTRINVVVTTVPEQTVIGSLIDEITGVITAGDTAGLSAEVEIETGGLTTTEFDAIQAAVSDAQSATITYINENFSSALSGYDAAKCARDVGLILDAVRRDLMIGSDHWTVTAGNAYLRTNSAYVLSNQSVATIQAVEFVRDEIKALTDVTNDATVDTLFEKIIDVLDGTFTTPQSVTSLPENGTYAQTPSRSTQTSDIVSNRATLISGVTSFINLNYGGFSYDQAACERDTGFIIDALVADLYYGGNTASRQAALAYFVGTNSQLGSGEELVTIAAYNDLATNIKALTNVFEDLRVDELIGLITEVISSASVDGLADEVEVSTVGLSTTEFDAIKNNTLSIQNGVIDFVNDMNPVNNFDDEKCFRDTGLIIDALAVDLQNNTNYNSTTAGLAYRRANAQKVQSDQLSYTVDSINYLRDQINASGINDESQTFITARIKEITDLLTESTEYGAYDGDPIFFTGSGSENADKRNAANALIVNRRTIQKQVISWLQVNYDTLEYNQEKCERDVGYIVDALTHDILFDGQFGTDTNARSYWVGVDLNIENTTTAAESLDGIPDIWTNQLGVGEVAASSAAYEQLKTIINQYIITTTEETRVSTLIDVIKSSINAADGSGITTTLPTITGESNLFYVNRNTLQEQVVFYANTIFPVFSYDQTKCRRDVGYILDGLTYDLKYGGNSATYTNQRSYFSVFSNGYGDLLGQNEITATIAAYGELKSIIGTYISGLDAGNLTKVQTLLDIIINSIQQSSVGTYQLGDFFDGDQIYQYNIPTGSSPLQFPDLITLGYKVLFNELYLAHQIFDDSKSQRLTIIRSSNAVAKNQGTDTTIYLKSGDYVINNPIKLPPKTSIIGDALRSTTIRPKNVDSDIFWADNGVYIKEITFRDHQNGAAVLSFDPRVDSPGAGPFITQSPYVQNCTSLTSSGIGLRIDGSKVSGLRSMVLDAFTQFNAGGIGVHLLNRGYSQLVSLFTVSTTTSVLAETGGQCSLTNSNSSFGERGLVATGGSPSLYNGSLHANYVQNDNVIRVNSIITQDAADYTLNIGDYKKPNYNDAIKFDSDNYYYTILDVSDEITKDWTATGNSQESEIVAQAKNLDAKYGNSVSISSDDNYLVQSSRDGIINLGGDVEIKKRDIVGGVPQWDYQQTLVPVPTFGTATADFDFGTKVILNENGSYLAVSAPGQQNVDGASGATQNNGAIYTYRRTNETWTQDAVISLPEVSDRSRFFSRSFDMSENGLWIASSTANDLTAGGQGACYIYNRTAPESSTWTQTQRITIPDGVGASVQEPEVTINEDGTDLLIMWKGQLNKVYYYQKNIDNIFILAQIVVPRSNFSGTRDSKIKLAQNTTHFVMGDQNSPRGYFTNTSTDSDQGAAFQYAKKQKLNNVVISNAPPRITTSDTDRWINFETDFPINTTVEIVGADTNDGTYTIAGRTANTIDFVEVFPTPGTFTDVQIYLSGSGVSEFFVFDEGQWITEDIIEAPYNTPASFGYGFDVDINTRGDLSTVGNNPSNSNISNEVSVIERARSDWRRVTRLEPQTPTDAATIGNDGYGGAGHSTTVGGSGDYIVIGARDRREDLVDANTKYGAVFTYYSILDETGSYEITVAPALNVNMKSLQNVSFHQRSLITASGHTFEYVGSGTNMFTAIPQNGGVPKKENEIQFDSAESSQPNFGLVYFTATDERGDFRIGEDLTINREEGNITGITFDRSLFAVLTPFILALEG